MSVPGKSLMLNKYLPLKYCLQIDYDAIFLYFPSLFKILSR